MSTEFRPTEGIFLLNGINVTNILHDIAAENKVTIPPLEDIVLKKSKSISKNIVENAQKRQDQWRKDIQRMKERKEESSDIRKRMRVDRQLSDENVAKKQIARIQQKSALEDKLVERSRKRNEDRKIKSPFPEKIRQEAQVNKSDIIKRAREKVSKSKDLLDEGLERLRGERKEAFRAFLANLREKTAFIRIIVERAQEKAAQRKNIVLENQEKLEIERNERTKILLENLKERRSLADDIVQRAQEKREQQKSLIEESHIRLQKERREELKAFLKELKEKGTTVDEIIERAQEKIPEFGELTIENTQTLENKETREQTIQARAEANDALLRPPTERREEKRNAIETIEQKRLSKFEERLAPTLEHFEKLKQRLVDIFVSAGKKRTDALSALDLIISKAQRKSAEALFASGNPRAESKVLSELDYYDKIKDRIRILLQIADERERTLPPGDTTTEEELLMHAFEEGRADHQILVDIDLHFNQKKHEILSIVANPSADTRYLETLADIPDEDRKKIHKIFYNIISYFLDPKRTVESERQHTLSVSRRSADVRRRPHHLLLSHVVENMVTFRDLFLLLMVLGDTHPHDTYPLAEKNLHDINLVLQQENLKSIFSGMLIDKALHADTVLHTVKDKIYDTHEPLSFFTSILHTLEENAAHVKHLGDELYTVIDITPSYFDTLGKDINKGMRTEMFTTDQIFERVPEKELEQERIKKTEEQIRKNSKKKKRIAAEERRKEFLKLIEEQNMTAHEKALNERRLIDLFF